MMCSRQPARIGPEATPRKGEMKHHATLPCRKPPGRGRRAISLVRSGIRRYPRELWQSMRPRNGRPVASSPWLLPEDFHDQPLAAAWLGHATVLLRIGGSTILTDPVLSHRIGPSVGRFKVGLSRLSDLPAQPEHLPSIDIIAISHAHFDHLDKHTLARLASERTTVVTAHHTRRLIPRGFRRVIELEWGREVSVGGVRLGAIRPRHWGARTAWDRHRGYNSYLIEAEDHRVLYAGDTALTAAFNHLRGIDLAIFGIGAYDPWEAAHATPEQVWSMFNACGGTRLLPVHHSTFRLSDEHRDEPLDRLLTAAGPKGVSKIIRCGPGQTWQAESCDRLCAAG